MQIQSLETGYIYNVLDFNGKEFLINNNDEEQWWRASRFKMYHKENNTNNVALYEELNSLYEKRKEYKSILDDLESNHLSRCELRIASHFSCKENSYLLNKDIIDSLIEYLQDSLEEMDDKIQKYKLSKM